MLNKRFRLNKSYQFQFVYKKGDTVPSDLFLLIAARTKKEGAYRVGFSVSNKIGKAVVRNAAKRRLRHAARENAQAFLPGNYYVFVARVKIAGAAYAQIKKEMARCLGVLAKRRAQP